MKAMNDTATITEKDRDLGIAIHLSLGNGLITKKINSRLVTYFQGVNATDRRRFYKALSDHTYSTPARDAARNILNAHMNSVRASEATDLQTQQKRESWARFNVEECLVALRKLGIEW